MQQLAGAVETKSVANAAATAAPKTTLEILSRLVGSDRFSDVTIQVEIASFCEKCALRTHDPGREPAAYSRARHAARVQELRARIAALPAKCAESNVWRSLGEALLFALTRVLKQRVVTGALFEGSGQRDAGRDLLRSPCRD